MGRFDVQCIRDGGGAAAASWHRYRDHTTPHSEQSIGRWRKAGGSETRRDRTESCPRYRTVPRRLFSLYLVPELLKVFFVGWPRLRRQMELVFWRATDDIWNGTLVSWKVPHTRVVKDVAMSTTSCASLLQETDGGKGNRHGRKEGQHYSPDFPPSFVHDIHTQ